MADTRRTVEGVVALFNASDDTVDMMQSLLTQSGRHQTLVSCHFADLKKGVVDAGTYLATHNPEVVIFDLSPPYDENWTYFMSIRRTPHMAGRGVVLTTTNKARLDECVGTDSQALEVVGKTEDLAAIDRAITLETQKALTMRLATLTSGRG